MEKNKLTDLQDKVLKEIEFYTNDDKTIEEIKNRYQTSLVISKLTSNVVALENVIQASERLVLGNKENIRKRKRYGKA